LARQLARLPDPSVGIATKRFEIRRRGPRARSKDGVDVYVAVQVKVRDNVDVDVNLNDARPAARSFRSLIDRSSVEERSRQS